MDCKGYSDVNVTLNGFVVSCKQKDLLSSEEDACWEYFDFEAENSLAAATGSLIWDASFAVIQLLKPGPNSVLDLLVGKRVLELGSGIGLAGLCCAVAGAHMMCTDIPSVSEGILAQNTARNVAAYARQHPRSSHEQRGASMLCEHDGSGLHHEQQGACYQPEQQGIGYQQEQHGASRHHEQQGPSIGQQNSPRASRPWEGSARLGRGSVAVGTLDFTRPMAQQAFNGNSPLDADFVLAIDIVWLKELVAPLAHTISCILRSAQKPGADYEQADSTFNKSRSEMQNHHRRALLAFGERSHANSAHFVSLDEVCSALSDAGCEACIHCRHIVERMGEALCVVVLCVSLQGAPAR